MNKAVLVSLLFGLVLALSLRASEAACGQFSATISGIPYNWDIRPLTEDRGSEWTAQDIYQHQYWWNFCRTVAEGGTACSNAAVCQKASNGAYYSCGTLNSQQIAPLAISRWIDTRPVTPLSGLTVAFGSGTPYATGTLRSTMIHILCDAVDPAPKIIAVIETPNQGYTIYMTAAAACPVKASLGAGVVATDPNLGLIWHLDFNGTDATWNLLASGIKTPGNIAVDPMCESVYWTPYKAPDVRGIWYAPFNNISLAMNSWDPGFGDIRGVAAGACTMAYRYAGDRLGWWKPGTGATHSVQDGQYMLGGEVSLEQDLVWYVHIDTTTATYGTLSSWDPATGTVSKRSAAPANLFKIDAKMGQLALLDANYILSYVATSDVASVVRSVSLANITSSAVVDLAMDSVGDTYVLENGGVITILTLDGRIMRISIPASMSIASISGI